MKSVLITGASRGLGLELAKTFLKNGWKVYGACREQDGSPEEIIGETNFTLLPLDITSDESIRALAEKLGDAAIDVLINNAGRYDSLSADDDTIVSTIPEITQVFQTNSIGPRMVSESLVQNIEAGIEKLIVTISSGMGTYAQLAGRGFDPVSRGKIDDAAHHWVYSASKTALNYAMLAFAIEHPTLKSVLVNPGWMKTAIGGTSAPIEPSESAAAIYGLISDHQNKLPNEHLVDYTGRVMEL